MVWSVNSEVPFKFLVFTLSVEWKRYEEGFLTALFLSEENVS